MHPRMMTVSTVAKSGGKRNSFYLIVTEETLQSRAEYILQCIAAHAEILSTNVCLHTLTF